MIRSAAAAIPPGDAGPAGSRSAHRRSLDTEHAREADDGPPIPKAPTGTARHRPGRKAGALVVLHRGHLVLYVERGGRTLLSWTEDPHVLGYAAQALASCVRRGVVGALTVERADGQQVLGSGHPVVAALSAAGFHMSPRGLRLRR